MTFFKHLMRCHHRLALFARLQLQWQMPAGWGWGSQGFSPAMMQWRGRVARHKAQHAHNRAERTQWQAESERILLRCLQLDPLDARSYVALGKLYMGQQRMDEAARLFEDGCAATGAFSILLWQYFNRSVHIRVLGFCSFKPQLAWYMVSARNLLPPQSLQGENAGSTG